MPKARRSTAKTQSNSRPVKASTAGTRATPSTANVRQGQPAPAGTTPVNRPFSSPVVRGPQSLIMPGMVALGCWLMAFTLFFLTTDPNRNLFGGMAVLMALLWSFSFGTRVRKLMQLRQRS